MYLRGCEVIAINRIFAVDARAPVIFNREPLDPDNLALIRS